MVFQEYQDPKLGRYLKFGYWYVQNKEKIYKIFISMFLVFLGIVLFNLVYSFYIYTNEAGSYNNMIESMAVPIADTEKIRELMSPKDIQVTGIWTILPNTPNTADFIAILENPNNNWYIEFDYYFSWESGKTLSVSSFLLPGEKRPVFVRGVTVNSFPQDSDLSILNVKWKRMKDRGEISRIFEIQDNIQIFESGVSSVFNSTTGKFSVLNRTIYDISEIDFLSVLYRLDKPVALGINSVDVFKSGDTRVFEQRWLLTFGGGLSLKVYPLVNLFDKTTYRVPSGDRVIIP